MSLDQSVLTIVLQHIYMHICGPYRQWDDC